MSAAGMLTSNQRPIPLRARPDLRVAAIDYLGVGYRVIKDPVGLQYHRLQIEQFRALQLLDGERSLEQLRDALREEFPTLRLTLSDLQQLITDLHQKGLVHSDRQGQGGGLVKERRKKKKERLLAKFRSLLFVRFPGWDPEAALQILYPFVRWMFHPVVVALCVLFVVSSWVLLAVQFESFRGTLPEFQQFFAWPNLLYMWCALGVAKVIHEFGHGLSCRHYGGECHEMGVMLLVFSPCLYCDVTDSWMLKNKWHRIIIAAAGMYIEIILSAIAVYVWWNTNPGLLHHLALNTFFVTTVTTVIFNANPLMRFDGYYIMSDFLEIPNLRPKSDKLLRESFGWYCLGIEAKPDPFMPETGRVWFVLYAVAAWCYRWVILFSISLFLYTVLKPYDLESIGVTLLIVSMSGIFYSMIRNTWRLISAPRIEPLSKPKMIISGLVVCGLLAGALMLPIPWHYEAPLLLEPQDVYHVRTVTAGQLMTPEKISRIRRDHSDSRHFSVVHMLGPDEYPKRIEPGDQVTVGEVLAVLENVERQDELRELIVKRRIQEAELLYRELILDSAGENAAQAKLDGLNKQIDQLRNHLENRIIRAKISGIVIAPPPVPEDNLDNTTRTRLSSWHGTPLAKRNSNCVLELGTHLLSIAPNDVLHAVLYFDQGDRNDLNTGQLVEIKLAHLPHEMYYGTISNIAPHGEFFAPEPLTTRYGGTMSTVTDAEGREKLVSVKYRVSVLLPDDAPLMKPGLRGHGRILMAERAAGEWLWRWALRTFHFRL